MIYDIIIFIAIIFLILMSTITYVTWLVWHYCVVAPPIQPEYNAETEIGNTRLSTWPTLTYAEAKSRDRRAFNAICCSICLVDYEEEVEDKALRFLPECGHLFHATCVDPWLWRRQTCLMCRALVMNQDMQISLAEKSEGRKFQEIKPMRMHSAA
ncbi:Putative RING-H2 finger protein ATL71 [Dendrobium catenatum]|uniref:RING-H2 finger protein ATL71 n=1 Tax=Dendrobium catenatum TaxID=906689 RepID=A0A2I0VWD6_9ASPA|nr:Putative RING-H2 finger protein ATL71 [Dendrobium catenatum]